MSIRIRPLELQDVEALARIEQESFSMPWSAQDFADLLTREYCTYYVAEDAGEPVACVGYTNLCGEANIDNVVVAPSHRRRGIAGELLQKLIRDAESAGVEAFTLEVRVSNASAIHLYEKLGFVAEGVRPRFYERPTEDALIMWKR